jgi:Cu/Ag efflux protein CusF
MNPQRHFTRLTALALVLSAAIAPPAWAASHQGGPAPQGDSGQSGASARASATTVDLTDGEVRKVDKDAGKLTLRHAEIKSLDMPPMTMVFVVRDKAMLDTLKAGDKIKFKAVNEGGRFTVTELQRAQ